MVERHYAAVQAAHPGLDARRRLYETLRRLLSEQIDDLVGHTRVAIADAAGGGALDAEAVRRAQPLVGLSPTGRDESLALKRFLFTELYRHPQVVQRTGLARQMLCELFAAYLQAPQEMSPDYARAAQDPLRTVADYVAGMTDRFAMREHQRLTGQRLFDW
jgi:dGTPase